MSIGGNRNVISVLVRSNRCALKPLPLKVAFQTDFAEAEIKVVKLSSVSTGPLRRLHALHCRPINLVVYQGTSRLASNET